MQNLSHFKAHLDIGPWVYNKDVLLKDHRVEEKQSFKHISLYISVYISIKYRKLHIWKKLFSLFYFVAQLAF